jgi:hypothetical protein
MACAVLACAALSGCAVGGLNLIPSDAQVAVGLTEDQMELRAVAARLEKAPWQREAEQRGMSVTRVVGILINGMPAAERAQTLNLASLGGNDALKKFAARKRTAAGGAEGFRIALSTQVAARRDAVARFRQAAEAAFQTPVGVARSAAVAAQLRDPATVEADVTTFLRTVSALQAERRGWQALVPIASAADTTDGASTSTASTGTLGVAVDAFSAEVADLEVLAQGLTAADI